MFRLRKSALQVVNTLRSTFPRSLSTGRSQNANAIAMNIVAHGHYDGIEDYDAREADVDTRPVADVTFKIFRKDTDPHAPPSVITIPTTDSVFSLCKKLQKELAVDSHPPFVSLSVDDDVFRKAFDPLVPAHNLFMPIYKRFVFKEGTQEDIMAARIGELPGILPPVEIDFSRLKVSNTVPSQCRQLFHPTKDMLQAIWKQIRTPLPEAKRNELVPEKGPITVSMDMPLFDITSYKNVAIHVTYFPPFDSEVADVLHKYGKIYSITDNNTQIIPASTLNQDNIDKPVTLTYMVNNGDYIDPIETSKTTDNDPIFKVTVGLLCLAFFFKAFIPRDLEKERLYKETMAKNQEIGRKEVDERETVSGALVLDNITNALDSVTDRIMQRKENEEQKKD